MGPGGKGANQAVAAARLGGDVTFVCKVGRDVFGENAVKGYQKDGINTDHILYSDKPSGVALILVDDQGENVISVAPGANGDITPEDIESVRPVIEAADYVILQLEIPAETVAKAAEIGHAAGACVILNPAPACKLPEEIFKNLSLITPNQTEIALLTGVEGDIALAMKKLHEMGVKDIILTLGSKGSAIWNGDGYELVPAQKVKAVDATAAGDTFCGGLCVGLSEGLSLKEAAEFATKASAMTVQKLGAQESIPHRSEIK
ncbi:MAG: ribokinase, partial [Bacteroidales bacterium]|nr:ribokinase [Candidatus Equibacterium intestinale]